MLSVIIATRDSERALLPTLKELVPGALDGLISEVIIADGGSHDDTATIADAAGCNFLVTREPLAPRLKTAAAAARTPWLMFLRPGTVLEPPWTTEVRRFLERPSTSLQAARFRRAAAPANSALRQIWHILAGERGRRPSADQGLIIAKPFYERIGGHRQDAGDPEADLLARIGRARLVTLNTAASMQILD